MDTVIATVALIVSLLTFVLNRLAVKGGAKRGPKPPYKTIMVELNIPRSVKNSSRWSTTAFVHLLDDHKRNLGKPVPANGLEEIPKVIVRLLEERRGLVVEGKEIRPKEPEA